MVIPVIYSRSAPVKRRKVFLVTISHKSAKAPKPILEISLPPASAYLLTNNQLPCVPRTYHYWCRTERRSPAKTGWPSWDSGHVRSPEEPAGWFPSVICPLAVHLNDIIIKVQGLIVLWCSKNQTTHWSLTTPKASILKFSPTMSQHTPVVFMVVELSLELCNRVQFLFHVLTSQVYQDSVWTPCSFWLFSLTWPLSSESSQIFNLI